MKTSISLLVGGLVLAGTGLWLVIEYYEAYVTLAEIMIFGGLGTAGVGLVSTVVCWVRKARGSEG